MFAWVVVKQNIAKTDTLCGIVYILYVQPCFPRLNSIYLHTISVKGLDVRTRERWRERARDREREREGKVENMRAREVDYERE